jgi:LmbE family N-acetylglucosaminyl deacetylase
MTQTLVALFAHPDDEAFGMAGTLRQAADAGWRTMLVCATRGEVGEISDPALATPETLGAVREGELRCAAAALKFHEVRFRDRGDSGRAGTGDTADPRACDTARADEIVPELVAVLRAERPDIVVTFEPYGGYGHPDHIAIHQHTMSAVEDAADGARWPHAGSAWRTPRVYYMVFPRSRFAEMRDAFLANGGDPSDVEQFDRDDIGFPDEQIDVWQDVSANVDAKWQALNCHRTQFGADSFVERLPEALRRQLMSLEAFVRVNPPTAHAAQRDSILADD